MLPLQNNSETATKVRISDPDAFTLFWDNRFSDLS